MFSVCFTFIVLSNIAIESATFAEIELLFKTPVDDLLNDNTYIEQYSNQLKNTGHFRLPNLLTSIATNTLSKQLLNSQIAHSSIFRNPWQVKTINKNYSLNHPINHMTEAKIGFVGMSDIPQIFTDLYEYKPLLQLFQKILSVQHNYKSLYLSSDPEGAIYGLVGIDGDIGGWHFDQHPFSCVWMLQKPLHESGIFQYVYMPPAVYTRNGDTYFEWDYDLFNKIHSNNDIIWKNNVKELSEVNNGDVYCFEGNVTYHMVTEMQGDINRVVFVTAFSEIENFKHIGDVNTNNQWGSYKRNVDSVHGEL